MPSNGGFPYWSDTELQQLAADARQVYIERYKREMQPSFRAVEQECAKSVLELLEKTNWLRDLGGDPGFFDRRGHKKLLEPARYLADPVISDDTLKVVGEEEGAVGTIVTFLDRSRFPWLDTGASVDASHPDVTLAIRITAKLWAAQKAATAWRTAQSKAQEEAVRVTLEDWGLSYVEPAMIRERIKAEGDDPKHGLMPGNYQEALKRGEFTREIRLAGAKCDVPARLEDGRLFPIECKVSGTALNSIKRLNRETGGKHGRWRSVFGQDLHTGAVLGGVFGATNLRQAQDDGIAIFFDHDLDALSRFLSAGARPRQAGP